MTKYVLIILALLVLALGGWYFMRNNTVSTPYQPATSSVSEEKLDAELNSLEVDDSEQDLSALDADLSEL